MCGIITMTNINIITAIISTSTIIIIIAIIIAIINNIN